MWHVELRVDAGCAQACHELHGAEDRQQEEAKQASHGSLPGLHVATLEQPGERGESKMER